MYKEYMRLIREWGQLGNRGMVWYLMWRVGWATDEEYELMMMYDCIKLEHVKADV